MCTILLELGFIIPIKAKSLGNTYFNLSGSHGQVDRGNVARNISQF